MSTLPNDGSVSGDPCHNGCGGQLVLRSPGNGYFLGCSNYRRNDIFENCKFKMAPNTVLEEELKAERREKRKQIKIGKDTKKALADYKKKFGSLLAKGTDLADYLDDFGFDPVDLKSKGTSSPGGKSFQ